MVFYKKNPSASYCKHVFSVLSIYVRDLEWVEEVKSLTKQAFEDLVPVMHFPVGQRGNDLVACHCNGVLVETEDIQNGRRVPKYKMSRDAAQTWFDGQKYLGLGASLHFGCHKVIISI